MSDLRGDARRRWYGRVVLVCLVALLVHLSASLHEFPQV